ncbi:MAG TPA: GFA family protein [Albitalea sp.]|nr:GFA family protein [Albitalea sp.]
MEMSTGGCACGSVRYEIEAPPVFSMHCQCRQCQRVTGAGHASMFGVPSAAVSLRGALANFELRADSGNAVTSSFCPACGSPIMKRSAGLPDMLFFHAASLDDPSCFAPSMVVWSGSAQPWDVVDAALERKAR